MRKAFFSALGLVAAAGIACQTTGGGPASPPPGPAAQAATASPSAPSGAPLEETTWELVTLGGAPLPEGIKRSPNLRLESGEKRLVGFGGCNRVFGGYALEGSSLKLSPLGTTKMGCLGPQMPLEKQFLDALERVTAYAISGSVLTLRAGEAEIATLRAAAPDS
ncbi:MAG TPA: META domain-containing protein [Thermoanaerobaculia bacterium]